MTRESILSALQSALYSFAGGRVYRSRKEQLPQLPAIVIRPESEDELGEMVGCVDSRLTVAIEVYAKGDIPEQAAETTLNQILGVMRLADPLGLGPDVQISHNRRITWNVDGYDDAQVVVLIEINYRNY